MKKVFFTISVALLTLTSCEKDEVPTNTCCYCISAPDILVCENDTIVKAPFYYSKDTHPDFAAFIKALSPMCDQELICED